MAIDETALDQRVFWDNWHLRHALDQVEGSPHNSLVERFAAQLGGRCGLVVDLACGQGYDAAFLARQGQAVVALDFSEQALGVARRNTPPGVLHPTRFVLADLKHGLPFADAQFLGVYSHLGLHYFGETAVRGVFADIGRVMRRGGIFTFSVKSPDDPYCGKGRPLGRNMYDYKGHIRHFVSRTLVEELLQGWEVICIDEYSEMYEEYKYASRFVSAIVRRV